MIFADGEICELHFYIRRKNLNLLNTWPTSRAWPWFHPSYYKICRRIPTYYEIFEVYFAFNVENTAQDCMCFLAFKVRPCAFEYHRHTNPFIYAWSLYMRYISGLHRWLAPVGIRLSRNFAFLFPMRWNIPKSSVVRCLDFCPCI